MFRNRVGRLALFVVFVVSSRVLLAQAPPEKVELDVVAKLKEEGMQRSQVMDTLSYLTDVYGPRLTGSPNIKFANEWAKKRLADWGLENAHLEAWGPFGRGWTLEGFTANVVEPQFFPLIAYPKAWSPSTEGTVRGEVVYLDAKTDADLEKYKGQLKGAIVMLAAPREAKAWFDAPGKRQTEEALLALANAEPPGAGPRPAGPPGQRPGLTPEQRASFAVQGKKLSLCYAEGAAVILEASRGDGGTVFVQSVTHPQSGETPFAQRVRPWAKDAPPAIPQIVMAVEHYNRLIRMIERGVKPKLELNVVSKFHDDDPMSYNVVAEIPGSDLKDEIVMLGAHFDSWHSGTGATDNAAGSAVCMEVVRMLKALDLKPRRTVRIGLWSGEEEGLLGSRAYVAAHFGSRGEPPRPSRAQTGAGGAGGSDAAGAESQENRAQQPPAPAKFDLKPDHEKFAAYFNLDNGTGKIRGVHLQGNEACRPIFRAWLAPFKDLGAATLTISNTGGTDHLSFDGVGLPGFQFIQDQIEYETRTHHSNMDVYDRIQADDMKQAAVIMASFVYHAAMRDEKLPRKPMPTGPTGPFGF